MNRILSRKQLSENVYRMQIESPLIASERRPGQFIILSLSDEYAERIPLTIADADPEKGSITIIFQAVGVPDRSPVPVLNASVPLEVNAGLIEYEAAVPPELEIV